MLHMNMLFHTEHFQIKSGGTSPKWQACQNQGHQVNLTEATPILKSRGPGFVSEVHLRLRQRMEDDQVLHHRVVRYLALTLSTCTSPQGMKPQTRQGGHLHHSTP